MQVMHEGQWTVTTEMAEALVDVQLPSWRGAPVTPVRSHGTVNALFRLGDDVVLRFPLIPQDDPAWPQAVREQQDVMRLLADRTGVQTPVLLAVGEPEARYPGWWCAYGWIPGRTAEPPVIGSGDELAGDLAAFIAALHALPVDGRSWDGRTRGGPLAGRDGVVRRAIEESDGLVDTRRVEAVWEACLAAEHSIRQTWIHADLMPGNLLLRDGRLAAVIDWQLCVGDPAVDLMPAWNLLPAGPRESFRQAMAVDDDTWTRGRGWALSQAITALPYYVHTNRAMVETSLHTVAALTES